MKIVFDHKFGHQEQGEFFYYTAELIDVEDNEYDIALENGFLLTVHHGDLRWFQCRSTRLEVEKTNYNSLVDANMLSRPLPTAEMDHIYTSYCYYKKFKKYFEVGEYLDRDKFIGYYHNDSFVAWSKLREYSNNAIETCQFVWDYCDPHINLGINSLHHEIAWAKEEGYRYVYLGPGYERSSRYKADLIGFEWWTGKEWSNDAEKYAYVCKRDSKFTKISDLYDI